jgi:hypothetical protein
MRTDWENNRDELLAFWCSGKYTALDTFSDSLPWLFVCGEPGTLPWAAEQFDKRKVSARALCHETRTAKSAGFTSSR